MAKLYDTPIKATRKECLDCSYWSPEEERTCIVIDCPNYIMKIFCDLCDCEKQCAVKDSDGLWVCSDCKMKYPLKKGELKWDMI
jgi:hypothetical protein